MEIHSFLYIYAFLGIMIALIVLTVQWKCESIAKANSCGSLIWTLRAIVGCFLLCSGWLIYCMALNLNPVIDQRFVFLLDPSLLFLLFAGQHLLVAALIIQQQREKQEGTFLAALGAFLLGHYVLVSLISIGVYNGLISKGA